MGVAARWGTTLCKTADEEQSAISRKPRCSRAGDCWRARGHRSATQKPRVATRLAERQQYAQTQPHPDCRSNNVPISTMVKRPFSDIEILHMSFCRPKRVDVGTRCSSLPPSNSPSQTSTLTMDALKHTPETSYESCASSIQHWVEACQTASDTDILAPPTPRSEHYTRGRHHQQAHRTSRTSRTPSSSKRPSLQTYRMRNMYHANIFVDHLGHLPSAIDAEVRRILAIDSWGNFVSIDDAKLGTLATWLQTQSQRNARECSLEGDWKSSLYSVVRSVSDQWSGALKTHMTDKREPADSNHIVR